MVGAAGSQGGESVDGQAKLRKMRLGARVLAVLVVLEVVEYWVGTTLDRALVPLIFLALVATWPIVRYFMHVEQLRGGGER